MWDYEGLMKRIQVRVPTRLDLAGGTLDLWPIHQLLDRKATVNLGVTLDAGVTIEELPAGSAYVLHSADQGKEARGGFDEVTKTPELPLIGMLLGACWDAKLPPLSIHTSARSPAGAGLGGSSCLGVAICAGIAQMRTRFHGGPAFSETDTIAVVQDVEARLIHAPTGVQDYWGGMRGNINVLRFPPGGRTVVSTFAPSQLAGIDDELILCYSGKSRQSAINNWEIFKRIFDGDRELLATFRRIGDVAADCGDAVEAGKLDRVIELSEKEWKLRLQLWPAIESVETKRLDQAARAAGARFSRVGGAGGGGVMGIFAPKDKRGAVTKALTAAGGQVMDATTASYGLTFE